MDPMKRKLILQEIEYWRSNKLLPGQYCDFLRNLYIEDNADRQISDSAGGQAKPLKASSWSMKTPLYVFVGLSFLSLIYFYFTSFHPVMQTTLSIALVVLLLGIGVWRRNSKPILAFSALGAGCLLSLLLGIIILDLNGLTDPVWTVALIAICAVLWIVLGIATRIAVLQLCGHFALALGYLWLIRQLHPDPAWITLQLYALPICLVLYLAGKRLFNGINSAGFILLIVAAVYALLPEAYGLIFTDLPGFLLQSALFVKMVVIGLVIWTYWRGKTHRAEWLTENDYME